MAPSNPKALCLVAAPTMTGGCEGHTPPGHMLLVVEGAIGLLPVGVHLGHSITGGAGLGH